MKVLAFNCSPNMHKGNTALILTPFLEGLKVAGADVELFYTRKLRINPCRGCFNCWLKTPGMCSQRDDMQILLSRLHESDIWVFATPIYMDGMAGSMKNLMDRILPIVQPFFEVREGHCRHVLREGYKRGKVVLVSNCGFWEIDNFDPLLAQMRVICKSTAREFAGALLRPHGGAMRPMLDAGLSLDDIFAAAREAGCQLIETGRMSDEALRTISRELVPMDTYIRVANQRFQQVLDNLKKR